MEYRTTVLYVSVSLKYLLCRLNIVYSIFNTLELIIGVKNMKILYLSRIHDNILTMKKFHYWSNPVSRESGRFKIFALGLKLWKTNKIGWGNLAFYKLNYWNGCELIKINKYDLCKFRALHIVIAVTAIP